MFPVIEHVRAYQDNDHCLKNQFFHGIDTLASLANMSHKHTVYAIKELIDRGILKRYPRPGRSTIYEYIPCQPSVLETPPTSTQKTLPPSVFTTPHNNSDLTDLDLTTTQWLCGKLLDDLVNKYGKEAVSNRVVVISKMNGQIKNKAGLLVDSLRKGYIPTSKELREKEANEKHRKFLDEKIKKDRQEQEEREKGFERDYDPETAKKAIADIMAKLGEIRQ
jgi:hypothetical protein